MLVKGYNNARSFLEDYEKVMLEQETTSQLLLYSAYHYSQNGMMFQDVFGAVLEEEETILLFSNIMPHSMIIYSIKHNRQNEAAAYLANFMGRSHVKINGIVAVNDICQNFIEEYKKHNNCNFKEKLGMDIMVIYELNEIKPACGTYRVALPEEAKLVAEWMIEFQLEALTSEMDYEAALKKAENQIKEGKIHFYEDTEHRIVSMAVASRKLSHGITITYIYTPEEYRGKGYAPANIYYLSKELLEQGNEFVSLFVDKKNPLSGRAYEKIGYKTIGDCYEYKMISVTG